MRIIGFAQLHNELRKQNLISWFLCMSKICDKIYIYDQGSDDSSREVYERFNATVIYSPENRFYEEMKCKKELLNLILKNEEDFDWIFWMDGDEVVENKLLENDCKLFKELCEESSGQDSVSFGHYNLWRSDKYYRIDDSYDWLDQNGVVRLWRNNGKLEFADEVGLHTPQYPSSISTIYRCQYSLIHRGFSTDFQIIERYLIYKSQGQSGWALNRLINEKGLKVKKIDDSQIPEFVQNSNTHPGCLSPIKNNNMLKRSFFSFLNFTKS